MLIILKLTSFTMMALVSSRVSGAPLNQKNLARRAVADIGTMMWDGADDKNPDYFGVDTHVEEKQAMDVAPSWLNWGPTPGSDGVTDKTTGLRLTLIGPRMCKTAYGYATKEIKFSQSDTAHKRMGKVREELFNEYKGGVQFIVAAEGTGLKKDTKIYILVGGKTCYPAGVKAETGKVGTTCQNAPPPPK
ncbi:hypothetical protein C8J56DRAFT_892386 [Mycena floridula]|nr:hypothetical protein C8J56DRAFT_892386 [Mycena floridula]